MTLIATARSELGDEFMVKSNVNDWVRCRPGSGSLVTMTDGTIQCANIFGEGEEHCLSLHFCCHSGTD